MHQGGGWLPQAAPDQWAPWKQRGGVTDQEWQTGSLALGTATVTLAWMKSGAAVAVSGGQGKGSMTGAFPCLMARLPLALYPATSFVHATGNRAGMACWICAGHLCPQLSQCQSGEGETPSGIQIDAHPSSATSRGSVCNRIEGEG